MNHLQIKNLIERTAWTAIQAFLATFLTLAPGLLSAPNLATARALGVSAIIASIGATASAVKTLILTWRPS